jgi:predicted TIM-barrel fold metal-dependent hydrolase
MNICRRDFLVGAAALSITSSLGSHPALSAPTLPIRVDAHCHLFNGRDLPMFGLLFSAILEENVFGIFAVPFATLLTSLIENKAPTYDDEIRILEGYLIPNPSSAGEYKRNSDNASEIFAEGLKKFIDGYTSFGSGPTVPVVDRNDTLILELLRRFWEEPVTGKSGEELRNLFQDQKFREDFIRNILQNKQNKSKFGGVDELSDYFSQFFVWASTFLNYHFQLAEDLAKLFGEADALHIMAASIVDFGPWPEPWWYSDLLTTPYQQADLIQKISLIQPQGRILVGYIGYDPWHHLLDLQNNIHPNAFDVVKHAVENMGFVGVKVYPPMGYRPYNNSALDSDTSQFPQPLVNLCNGRPGHQLDQVLGELYQYCNNNQLAVQAHCANTIGSHPDYAKRSEPKLWLDVIQRYKDIRLNLGHFGGIWDFWSDPVCGPNTSTNWPDEIAGMVKGGLEPNLYTDVADFSGVLNRWQTERCSTRDIVANLNHLLKPNPSLRSCIMYGSDWMMLDREPENQKYYTAMRNTLAGMLSSTELEGFLGLNAVKLLGLQPGHLSRRRFNQFFRDNGKVPPDLSPYGL